MKYSTAYVVQLNRKGKPWQARLKYKTDDNTWKEKSKLLPKAKGKKEAQRLANDWLDEMNEQEEEKEKKELELLDEKNKLSAVYEAFLSMQYSIGRIQRSTYVNNLYYYNQYIKPYLGNKYFYSINRDDIAGWLAIMHNKVGDNTLHTIYSRLKKVFNYYLRSGELQTDPFFGLDKVKKGSPKVSHLTKEQCDKFLLAVYDNFEEDDPIRVGMLLAYYAGLRRGEIVGLRWSDVDFDSEKIYVRSAVTVGGKEGAYTKNPKNSSSIRTIPLIPQLKEALQFRKESINPELNWFVCGEKDKFMAPQTFSHAFSDFVKRNNLVDAYNKKLVPHCLRHHFATVGINSGMDIASLALMMGHASRAMTLDTYGDANEDAKALAATKLAEQFKKNSEIEQMVEDVKAELETARNNPEEERSDSELYLQELSELWDNVF